MSRSNKAIVWSNPETVVDDFNLAVLQMCELFWFWIVGADAAKTFS